MVSSALKSGEIVGEKNVSFLTNTVIPGPPFISVTDFILADYKRVRGNIFRTSPPHPTLPPTLLSFQVPLKTSIFHVLGLYHQSPECTITVLNINLWCYAPYPLPLPALS
jgi:hypothetical protein